MGGGPIVADPIPLQPWSNPFRGPAERRETHRQTSRLLHAPQFGLHSTSCSSFWGMKRSYRVHPTRRFSEAYSACGMDLLACLRLYEISRKSYGSKRQDDFHRPFFHGEAAMLRWAIGFFVVALIAAVLGFGGIAAAAAGIAKFIFYIFVILFLASLLAHLLRGNRP